MTDVTDRFVVPFNTHSRVEFTEVGCGTCVAHIPDAVELTNHVGTVHGGALFTVAEAASGRAFMKTALSHAMESGLDPLSFRALVRSAQIRFRRPARGEIFAHARVLTPITEWAEALRARDKSTARVSVDVKDAAGTLVAEMEVEWHLARVPALAASDV